MKTLHFIPQHPLRWSGNSMHRFTGVVFSLVLLLMFRIAGAEAQERTLIELKNADSLVGRTINGESIRELNGHVRLVQGNVRVWCDRAIQYLSRNEVDLIGNVKVVRDTVTMTARRGVYYGDQKKAVCRDGVKLETQHVILLADYGDYYTEEKKAFFRQNVRIIDSTTTIYCDEMTYFEKDRKSIAVNNVRIHNQSDNLELFGDYLEHYDEIRYSKMTRDPKMIQIDTSAKGEIDTLAVKSIVMEAFDDSTKRLIATDSVAIVRGPMAARGGLVHYFRAQEYMELHQNPIVWYDDNQITGDTVTLRLSRNRLQRAYVRGRAFALSLSDSLFPHRYNQLTGRRLRLSFAENKLREVLVEQNAISAYFLYDDADPNGLNRTSGDTISMYFIDGKPDVIRVVRGVEGAYYPEKMILRNEHQYDLDGFLIRTNRPKLENIFSRKKNL